MLGFAAGKLSGSTGCNSFGGTYEQSGTSLAITLGATTLIGCPPPLDAQEQAVLAALPTTSSFTVDGETLTLLDADGAALLEYAHLQPVSLARTRLAGDRDQQRQAGCCLRDQRQ